MIGIYKITSPTGKVYIGQSWNIERRWNQYRGLHCKNQPKIYNSLKKHGVENHIFEVILEVHAPYFLAPKVKIIDKYEQHFINKYREVGFEMLNLKGASSRGGLAQETKDKMKLSRSKQVFSAKDKKKISDGMKRYYDKVGRKEKPVSKYARIDGNFSEEQRKRYSQERSGELNHFFGKKHSDETRNLMSLVGKDNKLGAKNGRARAILQYSLDGSFIKEWDYITQASKELNLNRLALSSALSRKSGKSCGFVWRYKTEKLKSA